MQHFNLIPRAQLCAELNVSGSTIKRWIATRNFPQPLSVLGRDPLFDTKSVQDLLASGDTKND